MNSEELKQKILAGSLEDDDDEEDEEAEGLGLLPESLKKTQFKAEQPLQMASAWAKD